MQSLKQTPNIVFCHRRSIIVRAVIAASAITLIGILSISTFLKYGDFFDKGDIILITMVCGVILLLGLILLILAIIRLSDPIYLEIFKTGEGRYRPYFAVKHFHVASGSALRISNNEIFFGASQDGDELKYTDKVFSIYLPSSVKITKGQAYVR